MSNKRTIAIDIDDTIADSTETLRHDINTRAGLAIPSEAYRVPGDYWGYYERVWATHGVADRVNFQDHIEEMATDQSHVPLLAGAAYAIAELAKTYHILLITSRDKSWKDDTKRWFHDNFAGIDMELYFTNNHRDTSALTKGQLCKELKAVLLIDDNVDHCQSALEAGVDAVLFGNYGWHAGRESGAVHCKDWPEVLEYIRGRK